MKNSRLFALVLALLMLLPLVACATGQSGPETTKSDTVTSQSSTTEATATTKGYPAPFSKYAEPVTITVGRMSNAGGQFAPGDSAQDNAWTRLVKETLNIDFDVVYDVDASNYDSSMLLAAASNTLPDTFLISGTPSSYALFLSLAKQGKLADITEAYKSVIGGKIKEYLDKNVDTALLNQYFTIDGKQYGFSAGSEGYNTGALWIRQDWLDELGLQPPKTIQDIENVALAFIKAGKCTSGIAFNSDASGTGGIFGQWLGILPLFNAYGSFPDIWIDDGKGGAVYGAVQPETREALATLASWTQKGIFDKGMIALANGDQVRDTYIAPSAVGMYFDAWWDPWPSWDYKGTAAANSNKDVNWVPYAAPVSNKDGVFYAKEETYNLAGQVVMATCEHPEAVIMASNYLQELNIKSDLFIDQYNQYIQPIFGITDARTNSPVGNIVTLQERPAIYSAIENYLSTGKLDYDRSLISEGNVPYIQGAYDYVNDGGLSKWFASDKGDAAKADGLYRYVGYKGYYLFGKIFIGGEKAGTYKTVKQAFIGSTTSSPKFEGTLTELRNTTFMQIISGEKPVSEFDNFVTQWNNLGGTTFTQEVNEQIKK